MRFSRPAPNSCKARFISIFGLSHFAIWERRHGIAGLVGPRVVHLETVRRADDAARPLDAAGAPAIGQRHLTTAERHLIAGNGDRLEDGAPNHPLCLLIEIGEIVAFLRPLAGKRAHSAASAEAAALCRKRRIRLSSAWKAT